ncbi:MAG: COR domain-containing protein, partial [Prochlorothrix sp.]
EIGQLTNLQQLDLSGTQLSSVPPEIGQLTNLNTLKLYNCGITTVPDWIQTLPNLETLDLRANPLPIPPELLEIPGRFAWDKQPGDIKAVLSFYFQSQTAEAQALNEAKILIIGEGGAGKTTLAQKLLNANYKLKEEPSTEGIDVLAWEFATPGGQPFRARIWDFGGQEIYHQTHQFFLSKRSLYILVADSRKEDTDFYYWLKTVNLLGGDSPVIIVKNEKQDRQWDINERQLRGEFLHLERVFAVNLATNRGLADLTRYIQQRLTTLDHVGTPLPPSWTRVRAILENSSHSRNTLDRSQYFDFCRQQALTNPDEMLRISDYLHDLGICLHFQEDKVLKHLLILKPEWGTAAAYKILDNPTIRSNLGHFTTADLKKLWTGSYAPYRDELLELMQKFKLCYEIPRQDHHYIAPQLLSENQPCYTWDDSPNLRLR